MKTNFKFDNSYTQLTSMMMSKVMPAKVKLPKLVLLNHNLAKQLGLDFSSLDEKQLAELFTGNTLPEGANPIAQAYAGHQFGHLAILGDGRAIVLGEHITPTNQRYDIQFKGSGRTPYSRGGDGKAALGPMLREYIISEAMYHLNIKTTRSLAVATTGENVMRETVLPGAILTRVAESHIRVGTFEYVAIKRDIQTLKKLLQYSIERHYPEIKDLDKQAPEFLKLVLEKQIDLITHLRRTQRSRTNSFAVPRKHRRQRLRRPRPVRLRPIEGPHAPSKHTSVRKAFTEMHLRQKRQVDGPSFFCSLEMGRVLSRRMIPASIRSCRFLRRQILGESTSTVEWLALIGCVMLRFSTAGPGLFSGSPCGPTFKNCLPGQIRDNSSGLCIETGLPN